MLAERLAEIGVQTAIHYPTPPHLQGAYQNLEIMPGALPVSEELHKTVLSLPMGPTMSDQDVHMVIEKVRQSVESLGEEADPKQ